MNSSAHNPHDKYTRRPTGQNDPLKIQTHTRSDALCRPHVRTGCRFRVCKETEQCTRFVRMAQTCQPRKSGTANHKGMHKIQNSQILAAHSDRSTKNTCARTHFRPRDKKRRKKGQQAYTHTGQRKTNKTYPQIDQRPIETSREHTRTKPRYRQRPQAKRKKKNSPAHSAKKTEN